MSLDVVISTPTVTGQVGSLLTLLSRILCVGQVQVNAGGFTDRSSEARIEGGTAFNLLTGTSDEVFVGYDEQFTGIRVDVATAGAGVTLTVEYWNGTGWVAVSGKTDGTTNLTVDGQITWTKPTDWAKNAVNGNTFYHVRLKTSSAPSVTPTANFLVVNWTIYDDAAGTNAKVYKSIGEDGTSTILLWVSDNGTEYTNASCAGYRLYESWDAGAHTGIAPTPTVAQMAPGACFRKSATADGTARNVYFQVNRDRLAGGTIAGEAGGATHCQAQYVGKFTSYVTGDAFNQVMIGADSLGASNPIGFASAAPANSLAGHYFQRAYTGSGGSTAAGATPNCMAHQTVTTWFAFPNAPDGSVLSTAIVMLEPAGPFVRGELTGVLGLPIVSAAAIVNGDIFTLNGVKYVVVRLFWGGSTNMVGPWLAMRHQG